jgi:hypothetical protein
MKNKKWGKNNEETLKMFLIDFKDDLVNNIKSKVLSDSVAMNLPRHKFYYHLRSDICKLPKLGSTTKNYWIARGWNEEEAEEKRRKNKMGNHSPMVIQHWINKGYSEEDAKFKIKSMRKLNKEYWLSRGYSEEDAINKVKEFQSKQGIKGINTVKILRISNPEKFDNKIEYWINKGYSEEEAKIKLKNRQTTFSLEKCIEKYGEEKGRLKWVERQKIWKENLHNNFEKYGDSRTPSSKFASDCIKNICKKINITVPKKEKWIFNYDGDNKSYDFTLNNKIIEFNGDYWHMNPKQYIPTDYNKSLSMTAIEKWESDNNKYKLAIKNGYDILVIWESEYKQDKEKVIQECINFLNE